ncbi:hypothetical protein WJX81_006321 [Elliptochloris bilobata]|uniref:Uncharacterized protein n=1 Tax=Elliptochloris bilobata TaxID=381761 RepID=A0AAW1S345_9CHLO
MSLHGAIYKGVRLSRLASLFGGQVGWSAAAQQRLWKTMPEEAGDVDMTGQESAAPPQPPATQAVPAAAAAAAALPEVPAGSQAPSAAGAPALSTPESISAGGESVGEKRKANYFEFAKRKWECEDTFRLPDGSYWPQVQEGIIGSDHGTVICRLCQRHGKNNNFAGEGYRHGLHYEEYAFIEIIIPWPVVARLNI